MNRTRPAVHETIQYYALRAHMALEEIRAGHLTQQWIIEIGCYVEIAWLCAQQEFANPPKTLTRTRELLFELLQQAEGDRLPEHVSACQWEALCQTVCCADGVWSRVPSSTLLAMMHQVVTAINRRHEEVTA